jgi:hypothetical protein
MTVALDVEFPPLSVFVRGPSVKPLGWLVGDNPRLDPIHRDGFSPAFGANLKWVGVRPRLTLPLSRADIQACNAQCQDWVVARTSLSCVSLI